MSKQFIKLVQDEELYEAICNHMVELETPKYNSDKMSLQDYGAQCVAFEKLKTKVKERLDSMHLVGQEYLDSQ